MQNAIEITNLKKCYGNKTAVNNISLQVEKGTIFGLLGANGAGKSTTIECVLGTKRKTAAKLKFQGLTLIPNVSDYLKKSAYNFKTAPIRI